MKRESKKKVVFLDRDGVINKKAKEHHYITSEEDFIFNEGIFDICLQLQKKGFEFIVITNQRGVDRGLLSLEKLHMIHDHMRKSFKTRGIEILDVFYCPHHSDSCDCRKPKDGMLQQACSKYSIDTQHSILISDSQEDVSMGEKFGIGSNIFIESDSPSMVFERSTSI